MTRTQATTFADVGDLRAYNRFVWNGGSSKEALNYGDNGLGAWELSTVAGTGPAVALPRSVVAEGCGASTRQPKRLVRLFYGEKHVDCQVRDIAPGGIIDLNPDAAAELGIRPPWKGFVDWIWL